jgi:thiol-disulfide isomerase/thioredoxin
MDRIYLAVLTALVIAACSAEQKETAASSATAAETTTPDQAKSIDWFEGSVDEAFTAARESGKPIYLYWSAEWCPPCHAIKATIFKSPDFIRRSRLFIAVYLDGDTENAQAWGEKFGVLGYPTMIVFDKDGEELTRIPGGIDLQAYANILDLTLSQASPAADIVAGLGNRPVSAKDCTLLAYYSWGQDTRILRDADRRAAFRSMYEACPAELSTERSILYFDWLDAALDAADADDGAVPLSDTEKAEALAQVGALLSDDRLARANVFTTLFASDRLTRALTDPGSSERAALIDGFTATFDRIAADESVYKRERIYTLLGRIGLERLDDDKAELSIELKQKIRAMVEWADQSTPDVYERQPIINALGNVLDEAGMDDVAKPLLLAELDKSKQPYYFMPALADIEQRAGNTEAAIDWLKKAWDISKGPATRFQWGYYYLNGLLEMAPDETPLIRDTTVSLISELQNSAGLYQRPKAQLGRLENKLRAWSEDHGHADALTEIRTAVRDVCATARHQDESRQTCDAFLGSA